MDFKLLITIVDEDKVSDVLDAARDSGATGATVIANARGLGLEKSLSFFGLELFNHRNVILVLAETRRADRILDAIFKAGNLDEGLDTGIVFQVPVDKALGLAEHVKVLEKKVPLT